MNKSEIRSAPRVIHLNGGLRAINLNGQEVRIEPATLQNKLAVFEASSYGGVFSDLKHLNLSVIGVDFYSHISEIDGQSPPNWRTFNKTLNTCWPAERAARVWAGISHAAFKAKNGHLWDCASKIGNQLRVCSWRIRQLSDAYHQQLNAKSIKNEVHPGQRYVDGYIWATYLAVQSYLIDACILRDYLAEFSAVFIFSQQGGVDATKVTSISGLIKKVLSADFGDDSLVNSFLEATDDKGWLKELGDYRDLVVHSAPLAQASSRLYAITDIINIDPANQLPIIKIPLPLNPSDIKSSRSTRKHFIDFEKQFERYVEAVNESNSSADAMSYIAQTHEKLSVLAEMVSSKSPVEFQEIVINSSDIIGEITIKSD